MATATPILDTRYKAKDGYPIKIRIIDGDKQRNISVGYRISDKQWNGSEVVKHPDAAIINGIISEKTNEANRYFAECRLNSRPIRIDLIGSGHTSHNFIQYLNHRAKQYEAKGSIVMDRKVRRFAKDLQACFKRDIHFDELNADTLRQFENFLIAKENCNNTRHKVFKFLGCFFANAVDEGKVVGKNPFKFYKIPKDPVKKEKLTAKEVNAIEEIQLQPGQLNDSRNLFLFSYYTKGSRFSTCLTFRTEQIRDGRLHIQMDKGKKFITIKIHPKLQLIIDQYKGNELLFPFLKDIPESPKKFLLERYKHNFIVNRHLKTLAIMCGIQKNLSMHVARHTLAQHLKETNTDIHAIQEVLGHGDIRVTQMYLQSLGDERLDKEMEKIYGS